MNRSLYRIALLVPLLLVFLCASVASAAPDEDEVLKATKYLHKLLAEAKELMRAGRLEEAGKVLGKARALKERLSAYMKARDSREQEKKPKKKKVSKKKKRSRESSDVLEALEKGLWALKKLGRREEARMMERVIEQMKGRSAGRAKKSPKVQVSRDWAKKYLEVLRMARHAFLEVERKENAELIERALHAMELRLEGRQDKKAQRVYEQTPDREQIIKNLYYASKIWKHFKNNDKAEACARVARELASAGKKASKKTSRKSGMSREQQILRRHMEILRYAWAALREANRKDAADLIERRLHAMEFQLKGRKDGEAKKALKRSPSNGQLAELLEHSSKLWKKFRSHDKSHACKELAAYYKNLWKKEQAKKTAHKKKSGRDRNERAHRERGEKKKAQAQAKEIKKLSQELGQLKKSVQKLRRQVEEILKRLR